MDIRGAFAETLRRDLLIALRRRGDIANPLVFFVIVIALFPLGIGPTPEDLARIAPGVLWVVALLASLLSTDMVFRADHDDGAAHGASTGHGHHDGGDERKSHSGASQVSSPRSQPTSV